MASESGGIEDIINYDHEFPILPRLPGSSELNRNMMPNPTIRLAFALSFGFNLNFLFEFC